LFGQPAVDRDVLFIDCGGEPRRPERSEVMHLLSSDCMELMKPPDFVVSCSVALFQFRGLVAGANIVFCKLFCCFCQFSEVEIPGA